MRNNIILHSIAFIMSNSLLSKDILAERGNILIIKLEVPHTPAGHGMDQNQNEVMVRIK
jgi:hypothetical protein